MASTIKKTIRIMKKLTFKDKKRKTKEYRKIQFDKVDTIFYVCKTKIKIVKPDGETNWMNIENAEFEKIKKILT